MPGEAAHLPEEAYDDLADLLNACERCLAWPIQVLLNLVALLMKEDGGDRPITVTTWLYALWATARGEPVLEWDNARAKHWDTAVRGSTSLKAGLLRRAREEAAKLLGHHVGQIHWDIEKFLDSVPLEVVMPLALAQGFDPLCLALVAQVHVALRVVGQQGVYGEGVLVTRSILAGCKFSCVLSRSLMYEVLERAHVAAPTCGLAQHQDDVVMDSTHADPDEATTVLVAAAAAFAEGLQDHGLKPSKKKTCILASSRDLAKRIQEALKRQGLTLPTALQTRDVGFDATAGRRRSRTVLRKRLVKVERRALRAATVNRHNKKAASLYETGLKAAGAHGGGGMGFAPSEIGRFRRMAAAAAGWVPRTCTTSLLALMLRPHRDPEFPSA